MAESVQGLIERTRTITLNSDAARSALRQQAPTLTLRLEKPKKMKRVAWREGTVDNEHLNRKKSKCCCVYKKPRTTVESSSSEDDDMMDCNDCRGHVENKKKKKAVQRKRLPHSCIDPEAGPSTDPYAGPSMDPEAGPSMDPEAGPSMDPEAGPSMDPEAGPSTAPAPDASTSVP